MSLELALAQPFKPNGTFEPKAFCTETTENPKKYFYDEDGNLEEFEFIILEPSKPWRNIIDFFYLGIELTILLISVIKCGLLLEGKLFVVVGGLLSSINGGFVLDSLEHIVSSPRMLAAFTICYLSRSKFLGIANTPHAVQYTVLKKFPYYIASLYTFDQIIRRQLVLTLDDVIFAAIYGMICQVELQLPQPEYLSPLSEYLQQKIFPAKEGEAKEAPKTELPTGSATTGAGAGKSGAGSTAKAKDPKIAAKGSVSD